MFITLEGIDGCGKTTQSRYIQTHLDGLGKNVFCTREPGGTAVGSNIRNLVLGAGEMCDLTELFLFMGDRAQHVVLIREKLKEGAIVVSDRFFDSTVAYQGYGRKMSIQTIDTLNRIAVRGLRPDLSIWIDIPVMEATKRLDPEKRDRIEASTIEFMVSVRRGYTVIAKESPDRVKRVDGVGTEVEVRDRVLVVLMEFLGKAKA